MPPGKSLALPDLSFVFLNWEWRLRNSRPARSAGCPPQVCMLWSSWKCGDWQPLVIPEGIERPFFFFSTSWNLAENSFPLLAFCDFGAAAGRSGTFISPIKGRKLDANCQLFHRPFLGADPKKNGCSGLSAPACRRPGQHTPHQ